MARNKVFQPERDPFANSEQVSKSIVNGPFSFLNPTIAHLELELEEHAPEQWSSENQITKRKAQPAPNARLLWRPRDNRKGRHPLLVRKDDVGGVTTPRPTSHSSEVLRTISKMFTHYPVWDISWLIAYIFTWGSIVWCINSFFAFSPFVRPSANFKGAVLDGDGITAFIGACLFFKTGSILLMFDAVNENRTSCFGWAVEKLIKEESGRGEITASANPGTFHPTIIQTRRILSAKVLPSTNLIRVRQTN